MYSIEFYERGFKNYKLRFITFFVKEEGYQPKLHNCREGKIFTQKNSAIQFIDRKIGF